MIKVKKQIKRYYKMTKAEKHAIGIILQAEENYDFSKLEKTKTLPSDEENFYVPEKWNY